MKIAKQLLLALAIATLSACGGGGTSNAPAGGDDTNNAPVTTETPTPTSPTTPAIPETPTAPTTPTTPSQDDTPVISEPPVTDDSQNGTTPEPEDDPVQTGENETPVPVIEPETEEVAPVISLSWTIPDAREDGTYLPVYEIAGYEVRYSKDQGTDVTVIRIDDPQKTDWLIENVAPGQYEFSIATIDSEGVYSEFSTQATTRVP